MSSILKRIARLDAHHRLIVSLAVGAAVFYVLRGHVRLWTSAMAAWDAFAVCTLALAWIGDAVPYAGRQTVLAKFMTGQLLVIDGGMSVAL